MSLPINQDNSVQPSFNFTGFGAFDGLITSNTLYTSSNELNTKINTKQDTLTSTTNILGVGSAITEIDWNKITLNKPSLYTQSEITSLLSSKENNLTFSTPLTRTTNTIGINLNSYVPFNALNNSNYANYTALNSCNYITNSTNGLINYSTTGTDANYLLKTGGTMTGNLILPNLYLTNSTGTTSSIYFSPTPSIYSLFSRKVPWAMYFAEDYNASSPTILPNYLNNGTRDATLSGTAVSKSTASGNGATAPITFISGTTGSIITFPTGSIPETFTILSLTRYTGATNNRRILQASTNNFLHGHWGGNRGVAHYDGWKTLVNSVGNLNDWVCTIGKNGGATPNNILVDGATRGTAIGGTGNLRLTINSGTYGSSESSDWALSCVMIWSTHLTDAEMVDLNTMINTYKNDGISIKNIYNSTNDDESIIESRVYNGTERTELLLFKGNDATGTNAPDRIRLKGANIAFDTYNTTTSGLNRNDENIVMLINENGNVGIGTTNFENFKLNVNGSLKSLSFNGDGANITNVPYSTITGKPPTFPADMTDIYTKAEVNNISILNNYPSYTAINTSNFANYTQLNNCNYVRHTSLTNSNYVPFTALASCNYITNSVNNLTNYPNYITLNSCNFVPFNALNNSNYANYTQLNNCNYVPFNALASCNYITTTSTLSNIFTTSNVLSNTSNILNTAINTKENILTFSSPIIRNINTISLNQSLISYNNLTDKPDLNLYLLKSGGTMSGQLQLSTSTGDNPIYITSTNTTANNCIQIKNNSTFYAFIGIGGTSLAGNYANNLFIESAYSSIIFNTNGRTSASTPNMIVHSSGNIGIGTTDPKQLLHIKGTNPVLTIMGQGGSGAKSQINLSTYDEAANQASCSIIATDNGNFGSIFQINQKTPGAITNTQFTSLFINSSGYVGINTTDPKTLLNVYGKTLIHNGLAVAPANGTYGNDGTRIILWPGTSTEVAYSLGIAGGTQWYACPAGAIHAFYTGTNERMRINNVGYIGINTNDPKCHLQVNGIGNINNGSVSVVQNGYMASGSLTIGGTSANYGGGNLWNTNTAGLLMECLDNTEIAVHDSQLRVASLMYYEGGVNNYKITIGRDMGWNAVSNVVINGLLSVSATNNSYVRCGANTGGYFLNVGSTSSDSSTMYNATSGGIWTSVTGALHINPSTANSIVYINFFNTAGLLSVGGAIAQAKLHVGSGTASTGNIYQKYYSIIINDQTPQYQTLSDVCAIFESSVWCKSKYSVSSDERIKTNIQDINDDEALQKILLIQPKKYEYIDKVERGNDFVFGFIAQQIKEVIPEAIKIEKSLIPNIFKVCPCLNDTISIPTEDINKLNVNDEIEIITKNDEKKILNIIEKNEDSIKISESIDGEECFITGSKVDDFHTLDKNYIYTLNVCATQELYKLIQKQNEIIEELKGRISTLENN